MQILYFKTNILIYPANWYQFKLPYEVKKYQGICSKKGWLITIK